MPRAKKERIRQPLNQEEQRPDTDSPNILVQEDGTVSAPFAMIVVGLLVVVSGRWFYGFLLTVTGFTFAVCHAAMGHIREEDKQEIRCNILEPEDIVKELVAWEVELKESPNNEAQQRQTARIHFIAGLEGLAKKYGRRKHLDTMTKQQRQQYASEADNAHIGTDDHRLELLCQQAAYVAYRIFPENDDQVVATALSLHALVAKDPTVRQRHLVEADAYGLDLPVHCMRQALRKAKEESNVDKEQQSAELQRKACLLLGALGDGDADVAIQIVQEDGLEAVIEAMNWYRHHEDVANWALWAVFILSYENAPSKIRTVELGGVPVIIQTLRNVTDCLEVSRHGVAILFDLMRDGANDGQQKPLDIWAIRKSALAAGLHEAVLQAMMRFDSTIDIIMMGQEILAGTDYRGKIPQYQPNSSDVAG